jgi:hypothetical protein
LNYFRIILIIDQIVNTIAFNSVTFIIHNWFHHENCMYTGNILMFRFTWNTKGVLDRQLAGVILHNSSCQMLCGSCKKLPRTSLQCFYIFLVLKDHWLLRVENWVALNPVLGGVRDVAPIHYPSCTDSIKRSLQSLVILLWLMLPRDHFVSRFFYIINHTILL